MIINVIGSGTWGVTIAEHLSNNGYDVVLYYRNSRNSKKLVNNTYHLDIFNTKLESFLAFENV